MYIYDPADSVQSPRRAGGSILLICFEFHVYICVAGGNHVLPLSLNASLAHTIRYAAFLLLSLSQAYHLARDLAVLAPLLLPKQAMPGELKHHTFSPHHGLRLVLSPL